VHRSNKKSEKKEKSPESYNIFVEKILHHPPNIYIIFIFSLTLREHTPKLCSTACCFYVSPKFYLLFFVHCYCWKMYFVRGGCAILCSKGFCLAYIFG